MPIIAPLILGPLIVAGQFVSPAPDEITIQAVTASSSAATRSIVYRGNVVVRYGPEKLTADRVEIFQESRRGVAEGHVTLIDPDGTARGERIEFSWDPTARFATGDHVEIHIANATFRAQHAEFYPDRWNLIEAEGTTCLRPTPLYLITSPRVTIKPGVIARIEHPRLSLFGHYILQAPTQNQLLTPAAPGIHLPTPGYKTGRGFGLTWIGGLPLDRQSLFNFNVRTYQQTKPGAYLQYAHSFVPLAKSQVVAAPRNDFSERFGFGYLDSVGVAAPENEERYLGARRASVGISGQVNGGVGDRVRGVRYSKADTALEFGGRKNGISGFGQVRLEAIRREDEASVGRVTASGSLGLPSIKLAPKVSTISRVDAAVFQGGTSFGWIRGTAGVVYDPLPILRLSAAGVLAGEAGTPQFDIDPLYAKTGVVLRSDLKIGGLRLSYLTKHDVDRGWFDNEFAITQVIGCLQAYYLVRQFPHDHRIGITLNLEPLLDVVRRRKLDVAPTKSVTKRAPPP